MRIAMAAVLLWSAAAPLFAADDADEVMTNQDVVEMIKAGFGEDLIVDKIKNTGNRFDVSTKAMIQLKAEKVPESIISLMLSQARSKKSRMKSEIGLQIQRLAAENPPETRDAALLFLVQQGDLSLPFLRETLINSRPQMRVAALFALGKMKDAESVRPIRTMFTDTAPEVRLAAATAVAEIGDAASVDAAHDAVVAGAPPLDGFLRLLGLAKSTKSAAFIRARLLEDSDPLARAQAAWALGEIKDVDSASDLEHALLKDQTATVRAECATALGKLKLPSSADALKRICLNDNSEARAAALAALGEFPAGTSVPFLIKGALGGNSGNLSADEIKAVLDSLRKLTHQDFGAESAKWLEWYEKNRNAIDAGGEIMPAPETPAPASPAPTPATPAPTPAAPAPTPNDTSALPPLPPVDKVKTTPETAAAGGETPVQPLPPMPPVEPVKTAEKAPELPQPEEPLRDEDAAATKNPLDNLPEPTPPANAAKTSQAKTPPPLPELEGEGTKAAAGEEKKDPEKKTEEKKDELAPPGIFVPEKNQSNTATGAKSSYAAMKGPSIAAKPAMADVSFGREADSLSRPEVPGVTESAYKSTPPAEISGIETVSTKQTEADNRRLIAVSGIDETENARGAPDLEKIALEKPAPPAPEKIETTPEKIEPAAVKVETVAEKIVSAAPPAAPAREPAKKIALPEAAATPAAVPGEFLYDVSEAAKSSREENQRTARTQRKTAAASEQAAAKLLEQEKEELRRMSETKNEATPAASGRADTANATKTEKPAAAPQTAGKNDSVATGVMSAAEASAPAVKKSAAAPQEKPVAVAKTAKPKIASATAKQPAAGEAAETEIVDETEAQRARAEFSNDLPFWRKFLAMPGSSRGMPLSSDDYETAE